MTDGIHLNTRIRPFLGIIDEVAIHNRALSEVEVKQNYEAKGNLVVNPALKLATPLATA